MGLSGIKTAGSRGQNGRSPNVGDGAYWRRSALWAVAVRVGLLAVALSVGWAILPPGLGVSESLHRLLVSWDAANYLHIAQSGYSALEPLYIAFFPLYPLVVRLVDILVSDLLSAALAVSLAASVVAGFFLQKLAALEFDDSTSQRSLWFLTIFPTAFFLLLPYTESLFLALSIGAFYCARTRRWTEAGILGMFSAATRMQGILLVPALAYEAWKQKEKPTRAAGLLLIPVGLLAYLALNAWVMGDALAFTQVQSTYFNHKAVAPWEPFFEAWKAMTGQLYNTGPNFSTPFVACFALVFTLACIGLLARSAGWLRGSYQVYAWSTILSLLMFSGQISFPRYLFGIFPFFFVFARYTAKRRWFYAVSVVFLLSLGVLFALYCLGQWAF